MKKLLLAGLLLFTQLAFATPVLVDWIQTVERTDGTPLAINEIGGNRVYFQNGVVPIVEVLGGVTASVIIDLADGQTHSLVVTTYDTDGNESIPSQIVTIAVPALPVVLQPPKPPSLIKATILSPAL